MSLEHFEFRMKQIYGNKKKVKHLNISEQTNIMEKLKGRKCAICGTSQNLQVHHICPRSKCNKDIRMNDYRNLAFLCLTCHTETHNMKHPDFYKRKIEFKEN